MPETKPASLIRSFRAWIGIALPLAKPDKPAIRHRLRSRQKSAAAFRIGVFVVIKFVALRLHLPHAAAWQPEGTRRRSRVFRRLRQDGWIEIRRFFGFKKIAATGIGIELRRRQKRIENLFLSKEITAARLDAGLHPVAVDLDIRAFAFPDD